MKAEVEAMIKRNEAELNAKVSRMQQKIQKEEAKEKVYREELASRCTVQSGAGGKKNDDKDHEDEVKQKKDGNFVSEPAGCVLRYVRAECAQLWVCLNGSNLGFLTLHCAVTIPLFLKLLRTF